MELSGWPASLLSSWRPKVVSRRSGVRTIDAPRTRSRPSPVSLGAVAALGGYFKAQNSKDSKNFKNRKNSKRPKSFQPLALLVDGDQFGPAHCELLLAYLERSFDVRVRRIYTAPSKAQLWRQRLASAKFEAIEVPRWTGGQKDPVDIEIAMDVPWAFGCGMLRIFSGFADFRNWTQVL